MGCIESWMDGVSHEWGDGWVGAWMHLKLNLTQFFGKSRDCRSFSCVKGSPFIVPVFWFALMVRSDVKGIAPAISQG